jgi:FKBP-type peptidyl-prolyl cis-trans isomerase
MNNRKSIFNITVLLSMVIFLLHSCNKEDDRKEKELVALQKYLEENGYIGIEPTSSGLIFVVLEAQPEGERPSQTDYVLMNFTASLVDGKVFETSDSIIADQHGLTRNDRLFGPIKFTLANLHINGLKEGLMLMRKGEKARIIIPSNLGFGSADYGIIPPYSTLIYDIELLEVITDPIAFEQGLLNAYLDEHEILADARTESGLYYIEEEAGIGNYPWSDETITLHYTGSLLDGRVFDTSRNRNPLVFPANATDLIPGFMEGVRKMRKGGKARLIIPWNLAYGKEGSPSGVVPPYSTIVFDVEIINIQ